MSEGVKTRKKSVEEIFKEQLSGIINRKAKYLVTFTYEYIDVVELTDEFDILKDGEPYDV